MYYIVMGRKNGLSLYMALTTVLFALFVQPVMAQDLIEETTIEAVESPEMALLTVKTNIDGVNVFLNGVPKGYTPLTITDIIPGTYSLRLAKTGYYDKVIPVILPAQTETRLYVEMELITGFLKITSDNADADIYLDGTLLLKDSHMDSVVVEVTEGYHTIDVRKFGWKATSETVYVYRGTLSEVYFNMEKATFQIKTLTAQPEKFNPSNPGILGQAHFNFTVTTPGSGILKVIGINGNLVYERILAPFTTWAQSVSWNGNSIDGEDLPEGIYTIRIEGQPASGWKIESPNTLSESDNIEARPPTFVGAMAQTSIDNSIFYQFSTIGSGGTSIGTIPSVRLLPKGTIFFAVTSDVDFSLQSGFSAASVFMSTVITPLSWMEISFRIGLEARSSSSIPVIFGSALKFTGKSGLFHYGALVRYAYATEPIYATAFTETGLAVGVLAGIKAGSMFIAVSEEVVFGSEQGIVNALDGHLKTGLSMAFQHGSFAVSTWGALYSPFSKDGIMAFDMISCGADFSFLIPRTSMIPSIGLGYTYDQDFQHNLSIRFGLGVLGL